MNGMDGEDNHHMEMDPRIQGSSYQDPLKSLLAGESLDWEYSMRRQMQEIVPNLFLGPYAAASRKQLDSLKEAGITHIVCVRHEAEAGFVRPNFPEDFQYLVVNMSDNMNENIIRYFPEVKAFLDAALSVGGRVLLHGNAGISRSGSLLIAYLMERHQLSYVDTLRLVQARRFCVSPNESFQLQLQEYEPMYRARLQVDEQHSYGDESSGRKRTHEEEEEEDEEEAMMMME